MAEQVKVSTAGTTAEREKPFLPHRRTERQLRNLHNALDEY
jgi:hypothetical protein